MLFENLLLPWFSIHGYNSLLPRVRYDRSTKYRIALSSPRQEKNQPIVSYGTYWRTTPSLAPVIFYQGMASSIILS